MWVVRGQCDRRGANEQKAKTTLRHQFTSQVHTDVKVTKKGDSAIKTLCGHVKIDGSTSMTYCGFAEKAKFVCDVEDAVSTTKISFNFDPSTDPHTRHSRASAGCFSKIGRETGDTDKLKLICFYFSRRNEHSLTEIAQSEAYKKVNTTSRQSWTNISRVPHDLKILHKLGLHSIFVTGIESFGVIEEGVRIR